MGLAEKIHWISIEDYLEGEEVSQIRHEYLDGVVHAMAGTSDRHNQICGNLYTPLYNHFADDDPCRPFMENMKLQLNAKTFYYPDVMVACDGPDADTYFREAPRLIVEVTSPSTEQIDRTEKLSAYQKIKSLKEYVMISQDEVRIDVYRRMRGNKWQWELLSELTEELRLESVDLTLPLTQVYRRVKFPPPKSRARVVSEEQ